MQAFNELMHGHIWHHFVLFYRTRASERARDRARARIKYSNILILILILF